MAGFEDALRGQLSPELLPALDRMLAEQQYSESEETISAPGALNPAIQTSYLEVDGTDAFTLADAPVGTPVGTLKYVICTVAANTPIGTLTPATATITSILFNAVGEAITLYWGGPTLGWSVVSGNAASATVTP